MHMHECDGGTGNEGRRDEDEECTSNERNGHGGCANTEQRECAHPHIRTSANAQTQIDGLDGSERTLGGPSPIRPRRNPHGNQTRIDERNGMGWDGVGWKARQKQRKGKERKACEESG